MRSQSAVAFDFNTIPDIFRDNLSVNSQTASTVQQSQCECQDGRAPLLPVCEVRDGFDRIWSYVIVGHLFFNTSVVNSSGVSHDARRLPRFLVGDYEVHPPSCVHGHAATAAKSDTI